MKNIKKFFVVLCAMLLVFSVAACKGKESNNDNGEKKEKVKDGEENNKGDDNKGDDNKGDDNKGADNKGDDNKGNDNKGDDNKGDDNKGDDNKGAEAGDTKTPGTVTMKKSGKSSNGKISFVVDEDDDLIFSVDPSYDMSEDAMIFIVPKGEYVLYDDADAVDLDFEFREEEPDANGRAVFEFFIYDIEPGEYDMVLTTDYDGYVCAKWSIKIQSDDVYEVDLSNLKEYSKPEGLAEKKEYKELSAGEWPSEKYPKPNGCELLGGDENATGLMVYVKWNGKQEVLNYIEVLKGMGAEAIIDLEDEEEINWYSEEVCVIYTADDEDMDIILFK